MERYVNINDIHIYTFYMHVNNKINISNETSIFISTIEKSVEKNI